MAFDLGESSWLLGFSLGYGSGVFRRKIASRDLRAVLHAITQARQHFGVAPSVGVSSCYEAGRDGFWLHRFLVSEAYRHNLGGP